jgi:hyperosmotically inducible periplasmic protein
MLMQHHIAAAATAFVFVGGCTPEHPSPTTRSAQDPGATASTQVQSGAAAKESEAVRPVAQVAADAIITGKVKAALVEVQGVKVSDVNVDTVNGTVTLKGFVETQSQADHAIHLAQATEGVKAVANQLVIKATP